MVAATAAPSFEAVLGIRYTLGELEALKAIVEFEEQEDYRYATMGQEGSSVE
jgi:hypothetical protein